MNIDEAIEEYNKLSKACNVVFPQTRNYKQMANWLEQLKRISAVSGTGQTYQVALQSGRYSLLYRK